MTVSVAQVIDGEAVVLRGTSPEFPGDAVWSLHVLPHWEDRCRLLIRTRARLRHPGEVFSTELAGPVAALIVRGMLLGNKSRSESSPQTEELRHVS